MAGMVETMTFYPDAMRKAAGHGFSTATDLADYLVRELGLPFREAHHITGHLVAMAENKSVDLADLSLEDMQSACSRLSDDIYTVLTVDASAASRTSFGGTAPQRVAEQVALWKQRLEGFTGEHDEDDT
ncbi:MAG: argininosuccinate lyase, partial [Pseudomonadota bacterium]